MPQKTFDRMTQYQQAQNIEEKRSSLLAQALPDQNQSGLIVDLGCIADNYLYLCAMIKGQVSPVIKDNAYGTGMADVALTLEKAGAPSFYVRSAEEALALRRVTQKPIYALNGFRSDELALFNDRQIIPVLNTLDDVVYWANLAEKKDKPLAVVLHFDTGMNRLGLTKEDTSYLLENLSLLKSLSLRFIMSHLTCADEPEHQKNQEQLKRFEKIARFFPYTKKSLANSSGAFLGQNYHFDQVRAGMALYGLNPVPEQDNQLKPAIQMFTRILQTRTIEAGETVGYGATFTAPDQRHLATVSLGYSHGFFRHLEEKGASLYFKGQKCRIAGRVSMDLVTVDISSCAVQPETGDVLEVIGPHQSIDDLARQAGTIPYEILTNLGNALPKIYL